MLVVTNVRVLLRKHDEIQSALQISHCLSMQATPIASMQGPGSVVWCEPWASELGRRSSFPTMRIARKRGTSWYLTSPEHHPASRVTARTL